MKVLLTNLTLASRTGTEIVTRDLALGLLRAGHEPCVFSPRPGAVGEDIARGGVPVVSHLEDVPFKPDIIHGHHHVETTLALAQFRTAPAIFVCHDRLIWHDAPPRLDAIYRYVAVDHNCLERLVIDEGIPAERTRVILNAVDLCRFAARKRLPATPARALVFSNYARDGADLSVLQKVCEEAGLELAVIGAGVGAQSCQPEQMLGNHDLVFAKARCALEALAVGCAVILCDWQGLGPMVTANQVEDLRRWNFGMRCLQGRLTREAIRREIARYDCNDAERVSEFVRAAASLDTAVSEYVALYEEALSHSRDTCTSIGQAVESLARKAGSLESLLRRAAEPFSMPPLPNAIGAYIKLQLSGKVPRMLAGRSAEISLEVDNRSAEVLASLPPFPVHFSYHWLDAGARARVVFDGERTPLSMPLRSGSRHSQKVRVLSPGEPGRYVLVLTLVQEHHFWFDALPTPVAIELDVTVAGAGDGDQRNEITLGEVASWVHMRVVRNGEFANLGFLSDPKDRMLAFVEVPRYLNTVDSQHLSAVLTTAELAPAFPTNIGLAVVDDPKRCFFNIHNRLANETEFYGEDFASIIHPSARLHPRCFIDEENVCIGEGVTVGANAIVLGRTVIREGVTIHAGAVIGSAGFQTSHRRGDLIELTHAGAVEIGAGCHIFANAVIARGLFRESTRIGQRCRVGNCAFVSHNCVVGDEAFIGHGAAVNGNVRIGANGWIGPGATIAHGIEIGEGANVSLGATVIRDVTPGEHVTGSPAIAHRKMLRLMAMAEKGNHF